MLDHFVVLAPLLLLPVIALLRFAGCSAFGSEEVPPPDPVTPPPVPHTVQVSPGSVNVAPGKTQQFQASLDGGVFSTNFIWTADAPGSISSTGLFQAPSTASGGSVLVRADSAGTKGQATVNLVPNSAPFVGTDTTHKGNWKAAGFTSYVIAAPPAPPARPANNIVSLPAYLQPLSALPPIFSYSPGTPGAYDPRAVQNPDAAQPPLAVVWFDNNSFTITFDFKDSIPHRIGVYCVDWDRQGRQQSFKMEDISQVPPLQLGIVSTTDFKEGIYYIWEITGKVALTVTHVTGQGPNCAVNAIFFQ